jgi:transcriptional regulator with XRE-family HTH domain
VSIGETLAEARRQSGLTVTQVSQQTRIRESIIRAIEQGDFSPCAGDFYARGHIRSIAGVVGADPAALVREYDEEHGPPGSISAADIFQPATPIKIRDPKPFPVGKALAVVVLAAAAFGGYRLATSGSTKPPATPAAELRPTVTVTPTPTAKPTPTHSVSPYPAGTAEIHLTAKQACWVGITDTSGKLIYNGVVNAGKSMTWRETKEVTVRLGNPPAVKLTVNGKNETPHTANPATVYVNPNGIQVASTSRMPVTTTTASSTPTSTP